MRYMNPSCKLAALFTFSLFPSGCLAAPEEARMEIIDSEWHLAGFENSLDLSGIASSDGTQVLVGSDESFYIQPGEVDVGKQRIESRRPIALPVKPGGNGEVDIEGIAFSSVDQAYYVAGSHGVGKKKADFQEDRHAVYRIPVGADGKVVKGGIRRASLLPWLEKTPLLKPHLKQPLQHNGLNIEGLACSDGKLYFGLRAPNKSGRGLVIEVPAAEIFGGPARPLKIHEIRIPAGRGIRELVAVKDGFLLLAGNASAEASKKIPVTMAPGPDTRFELLHWSGGGSAEVGKVGEVPGNGGKAEAMLVLKDDTEQVDLLVIFDGLPGGAPLHVRVHR
jgi:hypothetical protein